MFSLGLLILRIVLGIVFMGHGGQKLFGWFGGPGIQNWTANTARMGMRPAWLWGYLAALAEFGGGVLVLLGLLYPLGSLGIIAAMLVAIIRVHWVNGFWNAKRGYEFPLVNLAAALALALTGPGVYSLDAALRIALPEPETLLVGLVLVVAAVLVQQTMHPSPAAQPNDGRQSS